MEPEVNVNEDFKSQFKAYQKQQQRRLQNLMERKKEKQSSQKNTGSTKGTVGALSDLNLFKKEPPVKKGADKSVLESENEQLQDQLREARDENCRLYKLLSEKDFEIQQLQKSVQEERLALSGVSGLGGDVAATKIVELAKKNREMTAEFETERARVKQLNHKVKELERELQAATGKIHSLGGNAAEIKDSTLKMLEGNLAESPEVKALQEKLNTANTKVTEYRNQLQNVKQELKLTQKILAKEVGEDVNIQSLMTNSGSWRGRAQQILLLQTKVQELEHKLRQNKIITSLFEMDEGFLEFADPRKLSIQERNLLKIRSLEKEKKESLEKLVVQHNTLQKSHEELKKKLDASRARNYMLCGEVKMLKGQIGTLMEKGKHDDELLELFLSQRNQMQEILKVLSQKNSEDKESRLVLGQYLNNEMQKQKGLIGQVIEVLAKREEQFEIAEREADSRTQWKSVYASIKSRADPPLSEHSETPEESGSNEAGNTESARMVSTTGVTLTESAATEPVILSNTTPPEMSAGVDGSGCKTLTGDIRKQAALFQAALEEREKLMGMVSMLQESLAESADQVAKAEKMIQEERRQSDILKQQLEKLQAIAGSSTTAQKPALSRKKAQPSLPSRSREQLPAARPRLSLRFQEQELSTRLRIQLDEEQKSEGCFGSD